MNSAGVLSFEIRENGNPGILDPDFTRKPVEFHK